jgi:hypothetical protein
MADPLLYLASDLEAEQYPDPFLQPVKKQWRQPGESRVRRDPTSTLWQAADKKGTIGKTLDIRQFSRTNGVARGYQYTPWQMQKFASEIKPSDLWKIERVRNRGPSWVVHLQYLYSTYSKDGVNALLRNGQVQFHSQYSQSTAFEGKEVHRAGRGYIRHPSGRDGNHLVQFHYTNYITAPSWSNKMVGQMNRALQKVKMPSYANLGKTRQYDLNEAGDCYSSPYGYQGLESDKVPYLS